MSKVVLRLSGKTLTGAFIDDAGRMHPLPGSLECETPAEVSEAIRDLPAGAEIIEPERAVLVIDPSARAIGENLIDAQRAPLSGESLPDWLGTMVSVSSRDGMEILFDLEDPTNTEKVVLVRLDQDTMEVSTFACRQDGCVAFGNESGTMTVRTQAGDVPAARAFGTRSGLDEHFGGDFDAYVMALEQYLVTLALMQGNRTVIVLSGLGEERLDALPPTFMRSQVAHRVDARFVACAFEADAETLLGASLLV